MGRSRLRECRGRGLILNVVKWGKCCLCVGNASA
nr:MAG TPA: hypothetical protein [Caudoviricetes sp.]